MEYLNPYGKDVAYVLVFAFVLLVTYCVELQTIGTTVPSNDTLLLQLVCDVVNKICVTSKLITFMRISFYCLKLILCL